MIKLVDKIKKQLDTATPTLNRPIYQSKKIETIADDYAIEFLDWIEDKNFQVYSNGWSNYQYSKKNSKELLKIFKKEKGL